MRKKVKNESGLRSRKNKLWRFAECATPHNRPSLQEDPSVRGMFPYDNNLLRSVLVLLLCSVIVIFTGVSNGEVLYVMFPYRYNSLCEFSLTLFDFFPLRVSLRELFPSGDDLQLGLVYSPLFE